MFSFYSIEVHLQMLLNVEFPSCLGEFFIVLAAFLYCLLIESRFQSLSCQTHVLPDEYEGWLCLMLAGNTFPDKHDQIERPVRC